MATFQLTNHAPKCLHKDEDATEWNKVWVKTSPQTPGRLYRVTIFDAKDLAGNDLTYPNFAYFEGGSE